MIHFVQQMDTVLMGNACVWMAMKVKIVLVGYALNIAINAQIQVHAINVKVGIIWQVIQPLVSLFVLRV